MEAGDEQSKGGFEGCFGGTSSPPERARLLIPHNLTSTAVFVRVLERPGGVDLFRLVCEQVCERTGRGIGKSPNSGALRGEAQGPTQRFASVPLHLQTA
jgi:hypothetical protein